MSEGERRHKILQVLQQKYVITHEVGQRVIDGLDPPPAEWVNGQLKVAPENPFVSGQAQPTGSQEAPRSYAAFLGSPKFTGPSPTGSEGSEFQPGSPIGFNVHYRAAGPNPIQLVDSAAATYIRTDFKSDTQEEIVTTFLDEVKKEKKDLKLQEPGASHVHTMMPLAEEFFTGYAWSDKMQHLVFTQDDLDKLKSGAEVAFVISQIDYRDAGVMHHLRGCMWLQPPARFSTWHFCDVFNKSD